MAGPRRDRCAVKMRREQSRRKGRPKRSSRSPDYAHGIHTAHEQRLIVGELERLRRENEALRAAASTSSALAAPSTFEYNRQHDDTGSEYSDEQSVSTIEAELATLRGNNAHLRAQQQQLVATVHQFREDRPLTYASETATNILRRHSSFRGSNDSFNSWPLIPAGAQRPDLPTTGNSWFGVASVADQSSPLLNLVPALIREGGYLWKVTNSIGSAPKRRWFRIAMQRRDTKSEIVLTWCDPRTGVEDLGLDSPTGFSSPERRVRSFRLTNVVEVRLGHETPAWWMQANARKTLPVKELCWSLISEKDGGTLDLAAESIQEARLWKDTLQVIVTELQSQLPTTRRTCSPTSGGQTRQRTPSLTTYSKADRPCDTYVGSGGSGQCSSQVQQQLATAVREGRTKEVSRLFSSRVIKPDELIDPMTGDTALLLACRIGSTEMIKVALAHGARNDPHPTWGCTALQIAVAGSHVGAARALLDAAAPSGADAAIVNHVILASDTSSNFRKGDAPLHVAARLLDLAMVQLLLEHHADVLARDEHGCTPAHVAIEAAHDRAFDVVALLLDGASDELVDSRDDAGGDGLLHVAARSGARRCVELLVQAAANTTAQNKAGETPRQTAIRSGKYEIAGIIRGYETNPGRGDESAERTSVKTNVIQVGSATRDDSVLRAHAKGRINSRLASKARVFPDCSNSEATLAEATLAPAPLRMDRSYCSDSEPRSPSNNPRQDTQKSSPKSPKPRRGISFDSTSDAYLQDIPTNSVEVREMIASPIASSAEGRTWATPQESPEAVSPPPLRQNVEQTYAPPSVLYSDSEFYTPDGEQWMQLYCEEEQYPYFLHLSTGHTQWLDPRSPNGQLHQGLVPDNAIFVQAMASSPVAETKVPDTRHKPAADVGRINMASGPTDDAAVVASNSSQDNRTQRRSLSGGPIATAVDIFTVAGGKRAPSPSRSKSNGDGSMAQDARSHQPDISTCSKSSDILSNEALSPKDVGESKRARCRLTDDSSEKSDAHCGSSSHALQSYPSFSSILTRDESRDEYDEEEEDDDDLSREASSNGAGVCGEISPLKRIETDEQLMDALGDILLDDSDTMNDEENEEPLHDAASSVQEATESQPHFSRAPNLSQNQREKFPSQQIPSEPQLPTDDGEVDRCHQIVEPATPRTSVEPTTPRTSSVGKTPAPEGRLLERFPRGAPSNGIRN